MPYIANLFCSLCNVRRRFEEMFFVPEDVAVAEVFSWLCLKEVPDTLAYYFYKN
jgi:hypothetical protein